MGMEYSSSNSAMIARLRTGHNKAVNVRDWLEIWDYVGGSCFRGFVAEKDHQRSMIVFFEAYTLEHDLKPGYAIYLSFEL